jgi:hypothetical protein
MLKLKPLPAHTLSNSGGASSINREGRLLLIGILASGSVDLVVTEEVGDSTLVRVVVDSVLQLEDVLARSGVNVSGVALVALAVHVVLVLKAAGALKLLLVGSEADVEGVVAAGGAAEDELVDEERAVGLGVGAAALVAAVIGGGSWKGGGEAGDTESEDGGGTHFDVVGLVVGF